MTYFDIGRSFQGHFDITKYVQSPKRCQIDVNVVMMMINSLFRNFFVILIFRLYCILSILSICVRHLELKYHCIVLQINVCIAL